MATKKDKKAAVTETETATPKNAKYNTAGKRRGLKTWAEMSDREKVVSVIRKSAGLANKAGRSGLELKTDKPEALASNLNVVVKPGGKIDTMSAEAFKEVYEKAKKALPELKKEEYGSNVKDLLNYCLVSLKSTGGGGSKGFSAASVSDWDL